MERTKSERIKIILWNYRWVLLTTQVILCVGVFGVIHFCQRGIWTVDLSGAELKGGYTLEDGSIHIDETDGAYGLYLNVDTDEVKKGWYKVHVSYETGYDDNGFLIRPLNGNPDAINKDVGDEQETIALKSQHRAKSVHVWAEEATGLQISFHFCGGGYLDINGIELERVADYTPVFLLFFLFLITDFLFLEAVRIGQEELKKRNFVRGWIGFITLIASIPLMNRYVLMGNDMMFHMFRIEGIAEGLCSGQFPVRIMPQWWNEYGYGVPMFYGDIFLYFPAVLLLLNYKIQTAYKSYITVINLLTVWISYKSFVKIGKDEKFALAGAAIYSLNIFRLMSIYYNNGVGVYTAMAFLPLVIAGLYCIKEKRGWLYLALGLTGCIQSHLMTCEMIGIFIILFMLIGIKWVCQKMVFINLCKAGIAVLVWNLWFILPFVNLYPGEYKLKVMENFQSDIQQNGRALGDWLHAVVASFQGENNVQWLGVFIGITSVCGLVFVIVTMLVNMRNSSKEVKQVEIGAVLFVGATFMAMFLSTKYFPYDYLCMKSRILSALIHSLQFPWRFFEMATVFAVTAIIFGFVVWKNLGRKKICVITAGILGGVCLLETSFYYHRLLIESPQMTEICEYYAFPESAGAIEYLPMAAETVYERHQVAASGDMVEVRDYKKKYTTIEASCINHGEQEAYIDVPLFFYPCYKVKNMETGEELKLTYGENAKIRIILPPKYQGRIKLEVNERKLWKLADLISLISIAASVAFSVKKKRTEEAYRDKKWGRVRNAG